MVTQHAIKYAVHVITNHFGNLVAKVCECLLRKGSLSLGQAVRFTGLTPTQVKNSLLVLIQHNCVQAFVLEEPAGFGEAPKAVTKYMALFDNILHRTRFSKFMVIVSRELDKQCADILDGLLLHGRLTLKQLYHKANQNKGNSVDLDALQESLRKLVMARFVEQCPIPEPFISLPDDDEAPAKRRGAKSAKINLESETQEQRALAAAIPPESKRFSVGINTEPDVNEEKNENDSSSKHAGEKRKNDALESDIDGGVTDDQLVLYRANFVEFVRRLRHKACIDNVRARLDDGAAIVVRAMLEASRCEEKKVNSVPLSLNSIYEEVIKSEEGRHMTFDRVRAALVQLSSPPLFVRVVDELYSIDFKHIIEACQSDEVESIVLRRYGREAYRMFRLLSKAGHLLETDKIADAILAEKKDATKILYRMWQDDYLLMEKLVAGTASFLLWKINKQILWENVLDEMFHAALNLSLRTAHELEQNKEVTDLPPEKREGPLKEKFERLRRSRNRLEASRLKLDDAIMLFHDF